MTKQQIFQSLFLTAIVFAFLSSSVSSVLAFDPPYPGGIPWPTTQPWPTPRPLSVGETWSPATGASAPQPVVISPVNPSPSPANVPLSSGATSGGDSPAAALAPSNSFRTLASGASAWYLIGTGGVHMDVFLDAVPHSNVKMLIYAPNQLYKPIGQGTPYRSDPTRLVWSGGHWNASGNWYASVTNNNPMAIQYRLTSSAQDMSNKSCYGYWEWIGSNYVYWKICN